MLEISRCLDGSWCKGDGGGGEGGVQMLERDTEEKRVRSTPTYCFS